MMRGFGRRFVLLTCIAVFAVLGAASWLTYQQEKAFVADSDRKRVSLLSEVIRNGLKTIMLEGRASDFQKFIDSIIAEDIEAVRIFSENGVVLNSTIPGEIGQRVDAQHLATFKQVPETFFVHSLNGRDVYSTFFVINNAWPCQKCHGSWGKVRGILDLEFSTVELRKGMAGFRAKLIIGYLLSAGLLSGLIVLVYRRMVSKPLDRAVRLIQEGRSREKGMRPVQEEGYEPGTLYQEVSGLTAELERIRGRLTQCRSELELQEEKMASLGEVAAAVAHEIKNPLAGISGALQVMAEDIDELNPRKAICNEILEEISRLDSAVKDFMLYARPPEPHLLLTDIHAIIEKVTKDISETAARTGVTIRTDLAAQPVRSMVDPDQIERVFHAIVLHGMNAMPNGGILNISTRTSSDDRTVEIAFTDSGAGIPEAHLEHVFKPFFSTRHLAGGLRLAICKAIIEKHGGTISVSSAPGAGTSFHLVLATEVQ